MDDQKCIKEHVLRYFKTLYEENVLDMPFCAELQVNKLTEDSSRELESDFTKAQVFEALCSLASENSPVLVVWGLY